MEKVILGGEGDGEGWGLGVKGKETVLLCEAKCETEHTNSTQHFATMQCMSDVVVLDVLIYALLFIFLPKKSKQGTCA